MWGHTHDGILGWPVLQPSIQSSRAKPIPTQSVRYPILLFGIGGFLLRLFLSVWPQFWSGECTGFTCRMVDTTNLLPTKVFLTRQCLRNWRSDTESWNSAKSSPSSTALLSPNFGCIRLVERRPFLFLWAFFIEAFSQVYRGLTW